MVIKKIDKSTWIILLICFIGLFLAAYSLLDPDFSWHLRFGTDILQHGIKYQDQYSYTMPSFRFVDHSWIMSILFAFIYKYLHLGYIGVSILVALMGTAAAYFASSGLVFLIPLVTASYFNGFDVRSAVATLLFLPILIIAIRKFEGGKKNFLFAIPLILLSWANFHGGFLIGVIYMWGFFVVNVLLMGRKKWHRKTIFTVFFVFVIATLCTIITPYFLDTYAEALRTINNPLLKTYISEWMPLTKVTSFNVLFLFVLFLTSLWYDRQVTWLKIFAVLLCIDSFLAIRMVPLFCTAACFVIADAYQKFLTEHKKNIQITRLSLILRTMIFVVVIIFCVEAAISVKTRISLDSIAYPLGATQYLKEHNAKGNIFALMHWNSYLDEHLPQTKIFVDGRMLVWSQKAPPGELVSAFRKYLDLTHEETSLNPILNQYCVTTMMWYNAAVTPDGSYMAIAPLDLTKQLDKSEWKLQYTDPISVVYQRALPTTCITTATE